MYVHTYTRKVTISLFPEPLENFFRNFFLTERLRIFGGNYAASASFQYAVLLLPSSTFLFFSSFSFLN